MENSTKIVHYNYTDNRAPGHIQALNSKVFNIFDNINPKITPKINDVCDDEDEFYRNGSSIFLGLIRDLYSENLAADQYMDIPDIELMQEYRIQTTAELVNQLHLCNFEHESKNYIVKVVNHTSKFSITVSNRDTITHIITSMKIVLEMQLYSLMTDFSR